MKKVALILFMLFPCAVFASSAIAVWNNTSNLTLSIKGSGELTPGKRSFYHLGDSGDDEEGHPYLVINVNGHDYTFIDLNMRCPTGEGWLIGVQRPSKALGYICAEMFDGASFNFETHSLFVVSDLDPKRHLYAYRYYNTGASDEDAQDMIGFFPLYPRSRS